VKARKAPCGYRGEPRAVRLDGRFREHMATGGWRCAGGGRAVVIAIGEAQPGDVIEFAGGRQARVAAVLTPRPADDSPARYVTIRHDPAGLTVCFVDTLVRLASTVMIAPVPLGEGVPA
jgi:hypothetical protein